MTTKHLIITGRVQGVGYRDWLTTLARAKNLSGWVRNRRDGTVEALLGGEEDAIRAAIQACHTGPSAAAVTSVTARDAPPPASPGFTQLPTA